MEISKGKVPTHIHLMNPLITALHGLGGSATIEEIYLKVLELIALPDDVVNTPHPGAGNLTEIEYRLAWARTYLKKFGLLENSARGVWSFASTASHVTEVDPLEVQRAVQKQPARHKAEHSEHSEDVLDEGPDEILSWREHLLRVITTQWIHPHSSD